MTLRGTGTRPIEETLSGSSLLAWFDLHKRDLPWRQDRDPYRIWLSEVMLQQTRVAAVIDHYRKISCGAFPTIEKLASARESSVLAAWSGLGYYRRARMLHAAAKKIVKEHGGKFPATAEELQALPGIGRYTAAAIASIAFDQPVAVVDGNVERVLQRVQGRNLAGEDLWRAAGELAQPASSGRFQPGHDGIRRNRMPAATAPMSVVPGVRSVRDTRRTAPYRGKELARRSEKFTTTLACRNGSIFLVQRSKAATLMPGMWELPEIAGVNGTTPVSYSPAFHHCDRLCRPSECEVQFRRA